MAGYSYWRYKETAGNDVLEKSFRLRSVEKTSWKPIHIMSCRVDDGDDDDYDFKDDVIMITIIIQFLSTLLNGIKRRL